MTFREYWVSLFGDDEQALLNYNGGKLLWDASRIQTLFDASTQDGDAANEAEKNARRKVAIDSLKAIISDYVSDETLDAIVKKAQG